ncbi:MAG TPA: hypothetical protein DGG94_04450 [Micromonosporaceae bacterium]|nr:hypothetical protein [Micromonosporaceae bacterium]HCU49050.1 hypothetical protein [Micromonosporaceae bacterium]
MREEDEQDRWPTVNLRPDQLEQILATDVVETMRIDRPMQIVLARLEGREPPRVQTVRYGAPIALCTLTIALGSVALLLESRLWNVTWRTEGMVGFGILATLVAAAAVTLLVIRLREGRQ